MTLYYFSVERIVSLYQIASSPTSFQIMGYFMLICNAYAPSSSKTDSCQIHGIKDDALAEDLYKFNVDEGCIDVDIVIEQYSNYLSDLLDKRDPKKNIYVVDSHLNEWNI